MSLSDLVTKLTGKPKNKDAAEVFSKFKSIYENESTKLSRSSSEQPSAFLVPAIPPIKSVLKVLTELPAASGKYTLEFEPGSFDEIAIIAIAKAIKSCTWVQGLKLANVLARVSETPESMFHATVSSSVASALAELLEASLSLEFLDLTGVPLGDAHALTALQGAILKQSDVSVPASFSSKASGATVTAGMLYGSGSINSSASSSNTTRGGYLQRKNTVAGGENLRSIRTLPNSSSSTAISSSSSFSAPGSSAGGDVYIVGVSPLRRLVLRSCRLSETAVIDLLDTLSVSAKLQSLDLSHNYWTTDALERLLRLVSSRMNVTEVNMTKTPMTNEQLLRLRNLLNRNEAVGTALNAILNGVIKRNFKSKLESFRSSVRQTRAKNIESEHMNGPAYKWIKGEKADEASRVVPGNRFECGHAINIGRRTEMQDVVVLLGNFRGKEDEDFCAIFDGHGGRDAASYCADHLHKLYAGYLQAGETHKDSALKAFKQCSLDIAPWTVLTGTTALIAHIIGRKFLLFNLGDSRAVLYEQGRALCLNRMHRTTDPMEVERILELGGHVVNDRVNGKLSVTRAIGDTSLAPLISSEPDVIEHDLRENSEDDFIILASDGVWDVMGDVQATEIVREALSEGSAQYAAQKLVSAAFKAGSGDNISALVVLFRPDRAAAAAGSEDVAGKSSSSSFIALTESTSKIEEHYANVQKMLAAADDPFVEVDDDNNEAGNGGSAVLSVKKSNAIVGEPSSSSSSQDATSSANTSLPQPRRPTKFGSMRSPASQGSVSNNGNSSSNSTSGSSGSGSRWIKRNRSISSNNSGSNSFSSASSSSPSSISSPNDNSGAASNDGKVISRRFSSGDHLGFAVKGEQDAADEESGRGNDEEPGVPSIPTDSVIYQQQLAAANANSGGHGRRSTVVSESSADASGSTSLLPLRTRTSSDIARYAAALPTSTDAGSASGVLREDTDVKNSSSFSSSSFAASADSSSSSSAAAPTLNKTTSGDRLKKKLTMLTKGFRSSSGSGGGGNKGSVNNVISGSSNQETEESSAVSSLSLSPSSSSVYSPSTTNQQQLLLRQSSRENVALTISDASNNANSNSSSGRKSSDGNGYAGVNSGVNLLPPALHPRSESQSSNSALSYCSVDSAVELPSDLNHHLRKAFSSSSSLSASTPPSSATSDSFSSNNHTPSDANFSSSSTPSSSSASVPSSSSSSKHPVSQLSPVQELERQGISSSSTPSSLSPVSKPLSPSSSAANLGLENGQGLYSGGRRRPAAASNSTLFARFDESLLLSNSISKSFSNELMGLFETNLPELGVGGASSSTRSSTSPSSPTLPTAATGLGSLDRASAGGSAQPVSSPSLPTTTSS